MSGLSKQCTLSNELNNFIYGVSRRSLQNAPELSRVGIYLLKNFPAARDAVLDYFSIIFHDAVNCSLNQNDYDLENNVSPSLESVSMIGPELCAMGAVWAPFIAPWCTKLLMDIATDKANLPNSALQGSEPIRILLDITTQTLMLLNTEERAKCIDMMLGCRACSWAVGWVGRAEPALVAPRALALGADAAKAVLAHLGNHPPALVHVRAALLDLFNEAIQDDRRNETIPYLLNLATKSDIVLKALVQDIDKTLTESVIDRVYTMYLNFRHLGAWEFVGPEMLVSLMMRADVQCLFLLLKRAEMDTTSVRLLEYLLQKLEYECLSPDKKIPLLQSAADDINLVKDRLLQGTKLEQYSLARLLILVCSSLPTEFVNTISYVVQYSRSDTTLALLVRIISGTLTMHVPNDSTDLNMDTEKYQNLIKKGFEYGLRNSVISDLEIKRCFVEGEMSKDVKTYLHHYCLNVTKLLRWENSNRVSHLRNRSISKATEGNMYRIGAALYDNCSLLRVSKPCTMSSLPEMPTCHAIAELIDRVDMSGSKSPSPSVEVIIKVIQATVRYFFRCIHETPLITKLRGVQTACRIFNKLCIHSKLARSMALRELIETAMFREQKTFGTRPTLASTGSFMKDWAKEDLLLHLNQKHGPITQLTLNHTSVFHAGIIGKGVRTPETPPGPDAYNIFTTDNELLMGALMSCMEGNSGTVEGATAICLLLVELISPDVMYNGLPWPDEDFTKAVSIEREVVAARGLRGCVRAALRRCGAARPALCRASALLRAAAATALHAHAPTPTPTPTPPPTSAHHHDKAESQEIRRERAALNDLLASMTLGQLLPHPLCHMLELTPELNSAEMVQVLRDCLWNYTRDHVPSPALFTCDSTGLHWRDPATSKPPANYVDTMRMIIQKRIAKLGHLYPIMFLNLQKSES